MFRGGYLERWDSWARTGLTAGGAPPPPGLTKGVDKSTFTCSTPERMSVPRWAENGFGQRRFGDAFVLRGMDQECGTAIHVTAHQIDAANPNMRGGKPSDRFPAAVLASVVDKDEFVLFAQVPHDGLQA